MTSRYRIFAAVLVCAMNAGAGSALAQERLPVPAASTDKPAPPAPAAPGEDLIPLEVEVVIARYLGEKRVRSLPYSLPVNANDSLFTQLRIGADIPVVTPATVSGPNANSPVTHDYRRTGTSIDVRAERSSGDRFQVYIQVDDSSIHVREGSGSDAVQGLPLLRSFRASNNLVLRDGQTRQFTAATDPVTGEVVRIEVKLTVVK